MNDPGPLELHNGPTPPTTDPHGGSFLCMYLFLYSYSSPPPLPPYTGWLTSYPPRRFASGIASAYSEILFLWGRKKKKKTPPLADGPLLPRGRTERVGGRPRRSKRGPMLLRERARERTLLPKISPRSYICAQSPSRILALGLITVILRLVTGFLPVFATFHAFFFFSPSFSDALPSPFFLFLFGFIKA